MLGDGDCRYSRQKLDFTGDPTLVCAERARKKRREQEVIQSSYESNYDDNYLEEEIERIQESHHEDIKDLEGKLDKTIREYNANDREKDFQIAELQRQVRELTDTGHIVISVDLKSRESINRAKRIINSIDGEDS